MWRAAVRARRSVIFGSAVIGSVACVASVCEFSSLLPFLLPALSVPFAYTRVETLGLDSGWKRGLAHLPEAF